MARQFLDGIQIPINVTTGYVLTSDAAGNATWQAVPAATARKTFAFFIG